MSKHFGISIAPKPDGTWRWQLHVPEGSQQDFMQGIANSEAEAEAAAKKAQARYGSDISNQEPR
jgi:hypothetical protein